VSRTSSIAAANPAAPSAHAVRDAFDRIACRYDEDFTDSLLGRLQREAVWRRLDGLFRSGDRILDLGCGTGADALQLARHGVQVEAIDLSARMIDAARRKMEAEGLAAQITTRVLSMETYMETYMETCKETYRERSMETWDGRDGPSHSAPFDGAISNFGAINCVQHLHPVARSLGRLIRPGGHLALGLINRFCLWETAFYVLQGRLSKAARRWSNGGRAAASLNGSSEFLVYYHAVREVVEALRPEFQLQRRNGIGILVPPTYLERHARRLPRLTKLAATIDQSLESCPLIRATADHTLLVFRRELLP
jgi:SAM-dependent methyltransferase